MRLELKENEIIWMGRSSSKPEGFMIPTHLKVIIIIGKFSNRYILLLIFTCIMLIILHFKVLTIEEKPFVYARRVSEEIECTTDEVLCPHYNASEEAGKLLKFYS